MLSDLQSRIARIVAGLPEADGFALAGGGALILRGAVDRRTRDLDYFATSPDEVDALVPALEGALVENGLQVSRVQVATGFARLLVDGDGDQTLVDLAADARLLPPEPSAYGKILSGEELAADKVLAIFGRAEPRDFIDLAALEPTWGLEHLCALAAAKDLGFDPKVFAQMLGRFDRLSRDEFEVDDDAYERLRADVGIWTTRARSI